MLQPGSEELYHRLIRGTAEHWTPCSEDPEKWDCWDREGEEIPTDEQAEEMCFGCPLLDICREYAQNERPTIGIYGGQVWGRGIVLAERAGLS